MKYLLYVKTETNDHFSIVFEKIDAFIPITNLKIPDKNPNFYPTPQVYEHHVSFRSSRDSF